MRHQLHFLILVLTAVTSGEILPFGSEGKKCDGSIVLLTEETKTVLHSSGETIYEFQNTNKTIRINRAEAQGCGCFRIFTKRNGRGASASLRSGEALTSDDRTFIPVVRSVVRLPCTKESKSPLTTVSLVMALMAVVSVVLVVIRRRNSCSGYSSASTAEEIELDRNQN